MMNLLNAIQVRLISWMLAFEGGIGSQIGNDVITAYDEIKAAANPIARVVIAGAGLWLILGFGSQKTNEKVKIILLCVVAGFLIINYAQTFVNWAAGIGAGG